MPFGQQNYGRSTAWLPWSFLKAAADSLVGPLPPQAGPENWRQSLSIGCAKIGSWISKASAFHQNNTELYFCLACTECVSKLKWLLAFLGCKWLSSLKTVWQIVWIHLNGAYFPSLEVCLGQMGVDKVGTGYNLFTGFTADGVDEGRYP